MLFRSSKQMHVKMAVVFLGLLFLTAVAIAMAAEVESVAIVLPGPIGDAGWNATGYAAVQALGDQDYRTAYSDSSSTV